MTTRVDEARKRVAEAQADLESKRWHPPPVKHAAESELRQAEAALAEAVKESNATTETQSQLIERRKQELASAKAALAKAPPNSSKFDEAEKNVAIAEYRLAQASKPAAAAAAAFGGKSRRRRGKKVKPTRKAQRRKAKRSSRRFGSA